MEEVFFLIVGVAFLIITQVPYSIQRELEYHHPYSILRILAIILMYMFIFIGSSLTIGSAVVMVETYF